VQLEGANWTFRGRLAKFGGDLKGNPVKAIFDLVDHQKLQLKDRDLSARGMAEEMLALHFLVSDPSFGFSFPRCLPLPNACPSLAVLS
jgi:hypothetical protein